MHNYGDQKHLLSTYIDMVFVVKVKCYVSTDSLSLSQKQSVMSVQVHFLSQKQSVMSVHKQTFMSVQVHFLSQNKAVLQALFLLHCSNTLKHTSKRQDLFFFFFWGGGGGSTSSLILDQHSKPTFHQHGCVCVCGWVGGWVRACVGGVGWGGGGVAVYPVWLILYSL